MVGHLRVATSSRALGTRELWAPLYPPFLLSTSSPPFAPTVGRHSPSHYCVGFWEETCAWGIRPCTPEHSRQTDCCVGVTKTRQLRRPAFLLPTYSKTVLLGQTLQISETHSVSLGWKM